NPSSGNQIFVDEDIIIEDDVDPNYYDAKRVKDSPVKKYLSDLDLFYEKSAEPTISFTDIETFSIGIKDYAYSVVYFKSFFRNQHRIIRRPYRQSERVATIKAEKIGKRWKLSIVSIVFYDPEVHINEINPDISQIPLETKINIDSPLQTDSTIFLKWSATGNNVFPFSYEIYEGGMLLGSTRDTTYNATNLTSDTEFSFYIIATEDSIGRISKASETVKIATKAAPKPLPVKSFSFKNVKDTYKKGSTYNITWANKLEESGARLEIRDKRGALLEVIEQSQIRNSTNWNPDPYMYKSGKGYQFVLSDPKNSSDRTSSTSFKIVRKFPLILKVAPILIVGAAVGVVAGSG
ncbi:MAG: hypothetical protein AAGI07_18885, partial [Bacteroidota bacterium]